MRCDAMRCDVMCSACGVLLCSAMPFGTMSCSGAGVVPSLVHCRVPPCVAVRCISERMCVCKCASMCLRTCNAVLYSARSCRVMLCGAARCGAVWHSAARCGTGRCGAAVWCGAVPCRAVLCHAMSFDPHAYLHFHTHYQPASLSRRSRPPSSCPPLSSSQSLLHLLAQSSRPAFTCCVMSRDAQYMSMLVHENAPDTCMWNRLVQTSMHMHANGAHRHVCACVLACISVCLDILALVLMLILFALSYLLHTSSLVCMLTARKDRGWHRTAVIALHCRRSRRSSHASPPQPQASPPLFLLLFGTRHQLSAPSIRNALCVRQPLCRRLLLCKRLVQTSKGKDREY